MNPLELETLLRTHNFFFTAVRVGPRERRFEAKQLARHAETAIRIFTQLENQRKAVAS